MSDITQFPTTLNTAQWSRPSAASPRLAAPIKAADTTITLTNAPKDESGTVITGSFLMGIKNDAGYTETVWVPAAAVSADGLTLTGVVRGIDLSGLDYTTQNDSTLAQDAGQDSPVFFNISAVIHTMMIAALQGTVASGGNFWRIGDELASDKTVTFARASIAGNNPFFGWDEGTSQLVYSNDGISSTPFGTGAGVTGGNGITVTAGDIDVDLTDVTAFRDARNSNEQIGVTSRASDGLIDETFYSVASEAEAVAGTNNTKIMTPLRVKQSGMFGGDGSDGALSASSGTTNIDLSSARVVIKNYTSISLTGTADVTFTNPHDDGTLVIFKSQGDVTITSSATPAIDMRGVGALSGIPGATYTSNTSGTQSASQFFNSDSFGVRGVSPLSAPGTGGAAGAIVDVENFYLFEPALSQKRIPIYCGSGGGAGSAGHVSGVSSIRGLGALGGRGGGAFIIQCAGALNFTGNIYVDGADGADSVDFTQGGASQSSTGGGGGGGCNGSCLVLYTTLTASSGTITATGGAGGGSGDAIAAGASNPTVAGGGAGGAGSTKSAGGAGGNEGVNGTAASSLGAGGGAGGGVTRTTAGTTTGKIGGAGGADNTNAYAILENTEFF